MCRMFGYTGSSRDDLESLVETLKKSSEYDTVAADLNLPRVHGDGWGFAVYSRSGLSFHKSEKAIYDDDVELPATDGPIYAVFHARQTSNKKTISSNFSHPFFGDSSKSFIFLVHNGSLDEKRLKEALGYTGYTIDSELAAKYLAGRGLSAARELEAYTMKNSALNLLVLEIVREGGAMVHVKQFYNRDRGMADKSRYYQLCYQKLKGGVAVFSSTFNDYGFSGKDVTTRKIAPLSALPL